jgi:hypothetical protein
MNLNVNQALVKTAMTISKTKKKERKKPPFLLPLNKKRPEFLKEIVTPFFHYKLNTCMTISCYTPQKSTTKNSNEKGQS